MMYYSGIEILGIFHFPFVIFHFAVNGRLQMENGKFGFVNGRMHYSDDRVSHEKYIIGPPV